VLCARADAQSLSVTLTTSDYNGYAVGCSGGRNGWISAAVSGGTPPYTYAWSNGAQEANPGGLGAGYYQVTVMDSDSLTGTASTTLTEPTRLRVQLQLASFPNGYNISCTDCFNGSIAVQATDAVPPYTYLWQDGNTSSTRTGLGHKTNYSVEVTDANGCSAAAGPVQLTQPERDDWTMGGNSGTDPALHYLGTNDAADLVLKSNGQERLRLGGDGTIKLFGNAMDIGPVFRDEDGTLRGGTLLPPLEAQCRNDLAYFPFWQTQGNTFANVCPDQLPLLGTLGKRPLILVTDGEERMRIGTTGKVGIGTNPPGGPMNGYRLFVEDGIVTRDVLVKTGAWPDYVFAEGYRLMPLEDLRKFIKRNHHLPGIPSAAALEEQGGVALGDMQRNLVRTVEEQALYILELEDKLQRLEQRMSTLETSR
jgi:hypothetical protein